jgi:ribosomal protein S18 acetylase RimI-like enzyme
MVRAGVGPRVHLTTAPLEAGHHGAVLALARALPQWFNAQGREQIERDLSDKPGWVALDGGRVVGWVQWTPAGGGLAEMVWLGVEPALHRRGVGTALVGRLAGELRGAGVRRVTVSTVADSMVYEPYARTRDFYRAVGFRELRVDRGYFKDPRGDYDRLLLGLDL